MGESTIFPGQVMRADEIETSFGTWRLESKAGVGVEVTLAIRPEHITIGKAPLPLGPAKVSAVVFPGSFIRVTATPERAPKVSLLARLPADATLQPGDLVEFACDPRHVLVLTR
jgi:spermidine/putrescine transport system ATP-binding protein